MFRNKRGLSTILGSIFIVMVVLLAFGLIYSVLVQYQAYGSVQSEMNLLDQEKMDEDLEFQDPIIGNLTVISEVPPIYEFDIIVTNTGGISLTVARIYIETEESLTILDLQQTPISNGFANEFIDIGEFWHEVHVRCNKNLMDGEYYTIKLVTERARVFVISYFTPASVSGYKWNDLDGDGIKEDGEPGLAGWTIQLTGPVTKATSTASDGSYIFTALPAGVYTVSEVLKPGWTQTWPTPIPPGSYTVNLELGESVTSVNFGNWKPGSISGYKWNDLDGDGIKDGSESGISGWIIRISGPLHRSAITGDNGAYIFTNLPEGSYTVSESHESFWTQTYPTTPGTHNVTITDGLNSTNINFGNQWNAPPGGMGAIEIGPLRIDIEHDSVQYTSVSQNTTVPGWVVPTAEKLIWHTEFRNVGEGSVKILKQSVFYTLEYKTSGSAPGLSFFVVDSSSNYPGGTPGVVAYDEVNNPYVLPADQSPVIIKWSATIEEGYTANNFGPQPSRFMCFIGLYYEYQGHEFGVTIPFVAVRST